MNDGWRMMSTRSNWYKNEANTATGWTLCRTNGTTVDYIEFKRSHHEAFTITEYSTKHGDVQPEVEWDATAEEARKHWKKATAPFQQLNNTSRGGYTLQDTSYPPKKSRVDIYEGMLKEEMKAYAQYSKIYEDEYRFDPEKMIDTYANYALEA